MIEIRLVERPETIRSSKSIGNSVNICKYTRNKILEQSLVIRKIHRAHLKPSIEDKRMLKKKFKREISKVRKTQK